MPTTVSGLRAPVATDPFAPHTDIERLRDDVVAKLPGQWVEVFRSTTSYNYSIAETTPANVTSMTGSVVVPSGKQLEVEWSAPLVDCPAGTGAVVQLVIASTVKDGGYESNSNINAFAAPVRLHDTHAGTGASVSFAVQAFKIGAGTPSVQAASVAPVVLRYRIN